MRKSVAVWLIAFFSIASLFAQDAVSELESAINSYKSGDYQNALLQIQNAKDLIEREQMLKSGATYLDIPNWNAVKANPAKYKGLRVKTVGTLGSISGDGTIFISPIGMGNTFAESLAGKVGSLQSYQKYTWYGVVGIDPVFGAILKIERIE